MTIGLLRIGNLRREPGLPSDKGTFETENWARRGDEQRGYTFQTWGKLVDPIDYENMTEWEDRLGALTFGRGAVAGLL